MRYSFLVVLCAVVFLTACSEPATPEISGIPTFEAPVGLLPAKLNTTAGPIPTVLPAEGQTQQLSVTDIGINLAIPAGWSSQHSGDRTVIMDEAGDPMIEVGQAFGLAADSDAMQTQMESMLLKDGFHNDTFDVRQSVVNTYNYVMISGPEVDACEYAYLSLGLSAVALKFERPLCGSDGRLNDTAFAILRSLSYTGPLQ